MNGNGVQNLGCTSSVYVKMGSSLALTLTMSKSNPDAALAWNNVNLNSYNIFRGTRPDVMSLEGATANTAAVDPNVLVDGLDYFYTVDDPGQ